MTLSIDKQHTALLSLHLQNDIVDGNGAFKDFSFARMVAEHDVLNKTARLQDGIREAGLKVIHAAISFRPRVRGPGPKRQLWQAGAGLNAMIEGTWGADLHPGVAPKDSDLPAAIGSLSSGRDWH